MQCTSAQHCHFVASVCIGPTPGISASQPPPYFDVYHFTNGPNPHSWNEFLNQSQLLDFRYQKLPQKSVVFTHRYMCVLICNTVRNMSHVVTWHTHTIIMILGDCVVWAGPCVNLILTWFSLDSCLR